MPILDQSYQPYEGAYRERPWRILAILLSGLALARKRRGFTYLLIAAALPFLGTLILIYVSEFSGQFGVSASMIVKATDAEFFYDFVANQIFFLFVLTLFGAGLISEDLAAGAIPLYLSRPILRRDYILGKFLSVAGVNLLVTLAPAGLLWLLLATEAIGVGTPPTLGVGLGTALFCVLMSSSFALLMLAVSSLTHSRRASGIAFVSVYGVTWKTGGFLRWFLGSKSWLLFSFPDLNTQAGRFLLGLGSDEFVPKAAFGLLLGLMLGCLVVLHWRVSVRSRI